MKREIAAGLVLLLLAIGSWFNLNYLREFTGVLEEQLALSRAYCNAGRFDLAEEVLSEAADEWLGADGYTHIFIRHSEIDSTTDAFFELMSDVRSSRIVVTSLSSFSRANASRRSSRSFSVNSVALSSCRRMRNSLCLCSSLIPTATGTGTIPPRIAAQ